MNAQESLELKVTHTGSFKFVKSEPVKWAFPMEVPIYSANRAGLLVVNTVVFQSQSEPVEVCIDPAYRAFLVSEGKHPRVAGQYSLVHLDEDAAVVKVLLSLGTIPKERVSSELGERARKVSEYSSIDEGLLAVRVQLERAHQAIFEQTRKFSREPKKYSSINLSRESEQPGRELHAITHQGFTRELVLNCEEYEGRLSFVSGNVVEASFKSRIQPDRTQGLEAVNAWILMATYLREGTNLSVREFNKPVNGVLVPGRRLYGACANAIDMLNRGGQDGFADLLFNAKSAEPGLKTRFADGRYQIGVSIDGRKAGLLLFRDSVFTFGVLKDDRAYYGDEALAQCLQLNYDPNGRTVEFSPLNLNIENKEQHVRDKIFTIAENMRI